MNKENSNTEQNININAFKGGTYSLTLSAIVFAIMIAINVLVSVMPKSWTNFDMSSSKLYSITGNTKAVVNSLEKDVTIYWIVQAGQEDQVIENLLNKYESLSDHIDIQVKNPDIYPTFAKQYTRQTVENNSIIVECGDKYRYIPLTDIYLGETDMYSYTYYADSFDGEGAITSAIDYVVSDEYLQLYLLEGHGEAELPSTFSDSIEKENLQINSLSLLTVDAVPDDAAAVIIYSPQTDISEKEAEMLINFVSDGGKLLVMAGPVEGSSLVNLNSVASHYGVTIHDGIVVDENSNYIAFGQPYILLPDMAESDITSSLIEDNYYTIMPLSSAISTESSDNGIATALLTTSAYSFNKTAGFALTTYEKEEQDEDGPFALAVTVDDNNGGQIVWFASSAFMEDMYNAYSSGANNDMAMNSLSYLCGESQTMAIRSKSLNYNYLTISDSTASVLKVVMIGVFPLTYLGIGIITALKRRSLNNG